jgi:hypothetical protein
VSDQISWLEGGHAVADHGHLRDALVAHRERAVPGHVPAHDVAVDVAGSDRERADEGLAVALQRGLGDVVPLEPAGPDERELAHRRPAQPAACVASASAISGASAARSK